MGRWMDGCNGWLDGWMDVVGGCWMDGMVGWMSGRIWSVGRWMDG